MKKISTLFKKDPNDLGRVINEFDTENLWVFDEGVKVTQKFDGTACAIINGLLYKRYDVKKGRQVPENAIPCQEPDEITEHWPHWVKCKREDKADKWHFDALDYAPKLKDGTYELCGPKIQGNPEGLSEHFLILHGKSLLTIKDISLEFIREYLEVKDIEGIVFHHPDGRMCKIRKSDFGIKRIYEQN